MEVLKYVFSFRGRVDRSGFWLNTLLLVLALLLGLVVGYLTLPAGPLIDLVLFLAGIVAWLSGMVRRLHDRDKSAWYLLLFFGVPSVLQHFFRGKGDGSLTLFFFSGGIDGVINLVCLAILIWIIVELGFLKGTAGPNRFGPPPVAWDAERQEPAGNAGQTDQSGV